MPCLLSLQGGLWIFFVENDADDKGNTQRQMGLKIFCAELAMLQFSQRPHAPLRSDSTSISNLLDEIR